MDSLNIVSCGFLKGTGGHSVPGIITMGFLESLCEHAAQPPDIPRMIVLTNEPCKLSLIDGTAFLWPDSNISAYAGIEGVDTPYRVRVVDNTGKEATAFLGAVGGGVSFGAEQVTNGDFDTDINGWINRAGTEFNIFEWDAGSLHAVDTDGTVKIICGTSNDLQPVLGELYKFSFDLTINSGGPDIMAYITRACGGTTRWATTIGNGSHQLYWTASYEDGDTIQFYNINDVVDFNIDNISFKPVTDCPSTALRVVSNIDGSINNWSSIDNGFNYNQSNYDITIFKELYYEIFKPSETEINIIRMIKNKTSIIMGNKAKHDRV